MLNPKTFFDIEILKKGSNLIIETIQNQHRTQNNRKVCPETQIGFLRKQLPEIPSLNGKSLQSIIETVEKKFLPGQLNWQSPKYFGHFSLGISDTTILSQMLATFFHNPECLYFFLPSFKQLENIVVDWCAYSLNLPQKFLFKNSGGGIINNSATQSLFTVIHAAKTRKMNELGILPNDPKDLKFVGYYSQFCHKSAQKALILKDVYHQRIVKCFYQGVTSKLFFSSRKFPGASKKKFFLEVFSRKIDFTTKLQKTLRFVLRLLMK